MFRNLLHINCQKFAKQATAFNCYVRICDARTWSTNKPESSAQSPATDNVGITAKKHGNPFARPTMAAADVIDTEYSSAEDDAAERDRRLKVLQLEVDIAHQEGRRVPALEFLQDHHWKHILTLPSKSARTKYYAFLWQIEMRKLSEKRKREERAIDVERRIEDVRKDREENNHIIYGLSHTSLFLRIYDSTINHWQNNRLTRAMQFAPKIVLDCSYDDNMNHREANNAAKQLMLTFAENRANDEPFDLHYCNVNLETVCIQSLKRYIPTMLNPEFPMNVHQQCFTKVFPKQQLVYLTPHCREDLVEYNPDDVYIIGAMVDTVNNEPLSLAKAKRLGLRMARLPLDRYLQWGPGSGKSLTLNQMINIMLDLKNTDNWEQALRHVPRRKVVDMELEDIRNRRNMKQRAHRLNLRIDDIINDKESSHRVRAFAKPAPQQPRTRREGLAFNLDTWASNTKNKRKQSDVK